MDARVSNGCGETAAHERLKRLAMVWAQARGFSACAAEVSLPQCHYRADIAAYRPAKSGIGATAIFECKQALCDLRRDNCRSSTARLRLEAVSRRRQVLERNLRVHYPHLRIADSLFPEFDSHNFAAIEHRGYTRVLRELNALQNRLYDCTKFETLFRYHCANLFFLVLPEELFRDSEIPLGWGALVESGDSLSFRRRPVWQDVKPEKQPRVLERIAAAGTRILNQRLQITFEEVSCLRCR
jgi:hypothetical protein